MKKEQIKTTAEKAKKLYALGMISREQAEADINPYIDLVNDTAVRLAKEFGMKPKKINMAGYLR